MKKTLLILLLLTATTCIRGKDFFWKETYPPFDSLIRQAEQLHRGEADYEEVQPIIARMYRIAGEREEDNVMTSRALFWDICTNPRRDENENSRLIEKAISLIDTLGYAYDYHRLLMLKQTRLAAYGDYFTSYILCNRLMTYFEQIGDRVLFAYCMGNMGNILNDLHEYDDAANYMKSSGRIFNAYGLKGKALLVRLNLANLYYYSGQKDRAIRTLKQVVTHFPAETNKKIRILFLIAYCSFVEDLKEKETYLNKASMALTDYPNPYFRLVVLLNKAHLLYLKGETDNARDSIATVQANLIHDPNPIVEEQTYKLLSSLFARQNRYDSAYHYNALHQACQDSLRRESILLEVHHTKARKEIEAYRSKLEQTRLKAQGQRRLVYVILSFSAVIFLLLYKRAGMEKKLRRMENKEYSERIGNEQLVIDSQNRELSSNTILLTKKNMVLKNLLHQLTDLQKNGKLEPKTGRSLKSSIEETLREDDEWEYFKLHFEQVHPCFFRKLKETYPGLTDNELRLCAYSQLNLSVKQIAQMLSVQPKAIFQARYRLRKKMNLADQDPLNDYLRNF